MRVFLDRPVASGPVDGEGEFRGYPFTGEGSTGFPPPGGVLRSLPGHQGFEILVVADRLEATGAVTFGEEAGPGKHDVFPFKVKIATGVCYTGFDWYGEALTEMAQMAAKYRITEEDARAGVLLHRAWVVLEADKVVTSRQWLLNDL